MFGKRKRKWGVNRTKAHEICHNFIMKYMILYIRHTNKKRLDWYEIYILHLDLYLSPCQIVDFDNLSSLELG